MIRTLIFLFACSLLILACGNDELDKRENGDLNLQREFLGLRTLSWINPYLNNSLAVYENEFGDRETYTIFVSEKSFTKIDVKEASGEKFDITFQSINDIKRSFKITLIGNTIVHFTILPAPQRFYPELFSIKYFILFGEFAYYINFNCNDRDVTDSWYKYSEIGFYNDECYLEFGETSNSLFKNVKLVQQRGLVSYLDFEGVEWQLVEIK